MRFMMLVKGDESSESGVLPDEAQLAEMARYNEEMVRAGVMLAGEGLRPTSKGARVRSAGGKVSVTDGPFTEAKELVAGYWIIRAKSWAEALDWAKRVPGIEGEIEVRQVFELEDFAVDPAEQPDGWRDKEKKFREETGGGQKAAPPAKKGEKRQRYICFVKADASTEAGAMPDEKGLEAMGQLMDEAAKSGVLLAAEGLHPSSKGARVRFEGKKRTVTDGPFAETKELVAGFALFVASSKEEAIEFARKFVVVDAPLREGGVSEVELRQLFELEDFPASKAVEHHARLREELEARG
jgi:hypothetical protein